MSGIFQEREKLCQVPRATEVGLGRGLGLLDKGSQSQGPEGSTTLRAPRWPPLLATDDLLPPGLWETSNTDAFILPALLPTREPGGR